MLSKWNLIFGHYQISNIFGHYQNGSEQYKSDLVEMWRNCFKDYNWSQEDQIITTWSNMFLAGLEENHKVDQLPLLQV